MPECLERVKGIEPSSLGWEPRALPLSYTRVRRFYERLPSRGNRSISRCCRRHG